MGIFRQPLIYMILQAFLICHKKRPVPYLNPGKKSRNSFLVHLPTPPYPLSTPQIPPPRRGRVRPARHREPRPASRDFSRGGRALRQGGRGGGEGLNKSGISRLKIRFLPIVILLDPALKGMRSQFFLPRCIEGLGQTLIADVAKSMMIGLTL
jgi:hypothetical protein